MKTLHTIYTSFAKRAAIILTLLLTLGVTSAWAQEEELVYTLNGMLDDGNNDYTKESTITQSNISWSIKGNTQMTPWRIGGKSLTKVDRAIYSTTDIDEDISKIVITHGGASSITVNSMTVIVSTLENGGGTVISTLTPTFKANGDVTITRPDGKEWSNAFYKIVYNVTVSGTSNKFIEFTSAKFYKTTAPSTFTVTCEVNEETPWGTLSSTDPISGLASGTSISAEGNVLTIGETEITATPNAQDANYTYAFSNWSEIPAGGKVTENITVTANFTRTARELTNYRTTCTEPSTFTVTYDENGATSGSVPTGATEYAKDAQVTVLGNTGDLAKIGYTFSGWNTKADGSGNNYAAGATFTITENTTLYAKWTAKIDPAIAWNPTTCTVTIDAGEELPIFQNPNNLTPITFESSNSEVASVDNNGVITLGTTATTAIVTITATFDGDATYAAKEATCTLTVHPSNCRWVEVTDNTTLEDGDWVVIAMANAGNIYALPNNQGTSTPDGTLIDNLDGNKINTVVDELKWTVEKTEGNYIFHPNGDNSKWLYCTDANEGVRVGTNSNKTFTIDQTTGYLKHIATSRYLRIGFKNSTEPVWRCYDTNTGAQTLKFYKRECLDASKVWVEGNLTNVTCSPQLPQQLAKEGSITLTFTAADGYALPNDVTVTNATKTWNKADGTLTISNPTDNVMVIVEAVELHTITWMVGGSELTTGSQTTSVENGKQITAIPAKPNDNTLEDCGATKFMGWSTMSSGSTPKEADYYDDLFTTAAESPEITEPTTFYAVFASAEGGNDYVQISSENDLVAGSKYLIVGNSSSTYKALPVDKATSLTNVYPSSSKISNPADELIWTLEGTVDKWKIKSTSNNKYLQINQGNLSFVNSTTLTFAVTVSSSIFTFTSSASSGNKILSYYHSGDPSQFNAYNKPNTVYIYQQDVSYSNYVTNCCATPAPTNGTFDNVTGSGNAMSLTLNWEGSASRYHITCANPIIDDHIEESTSYNVSSLTECEEYTFYVSADPEDGCESAAIQISAQPFSGAKTVTFVYGNEQPNTTFTTDCDNQSTTLPTPTRSGYRFLGWFTEESGGTEITENPYTPTTDITLHAQWVQVFTVTYNPNNATSGTVPTDANSPYDINKIVTVQGNTGNLQRLGYNFVGWNTAIDASGTQYSEGQTFTIKENTTLYAQWIENYCTLTFTIPSGGGQAVSAPEQVLNGYPITFPEVTGISSEYWCETFIGWTTEEPNGEGLWDGTPTIYESGTNSEAITANTTFYAVYQRSGGGASGSVQLTNTKIATRGYEDDESSITEEDGSVWGIKCYVGNSSGSLFMQLKDGSYYIKTPTVAGNITLLTINYTAVSSDSRTIYFNTKASKDGAVTHQFNAPSVDPSSGNHDYTWDVSTANTKTGYILASSTFKINSIKLDYGPAPIISHSLQCGCAIDEFNLTYDANETNFPNSTTNCEGVIGYKFSEHEDKYTICSSVPTLDGYKFIGWTTNANGSGDLYTSGQEIKCVPSSDITLYAQYERVYTVIFDDQNTINATTQTESGAAVDVPTATEPCGSEWQFVGWSTEEIAPMSLKPTITIEPGINTYIPEGNVTLYAIYQKTSLSKEFVAGKTGAYKISNGSDEYASTFYSSHLQSVNNLADATTYYITYTASDDGKYTIQQADGLYIAYSGESTSLKRSEEPYYWKITKNGELWQVATIPDGRYLKCSSGFRAYLDAGNIGLIATEGQYYYRTMSCDDNFDITFNNQNGAIIHWQNGYPQAAYQDLEGGTTITTFPTASYEGWTFIGWRAQEYEESTSAPESSSVYGGLDGTSGNALTITANVTMYPVFTQFLDNDPFDEVNGGDYYMYYIADENLDDSSLDEYGATNRIYAGEYNDYSFRSTQSCADATLFTFAKLPNGKWTIYDNTRDKFVYGVNNDNKLEDRAQTADGKIKYVKEWTIEVNKGNQVNAVSVDGYILSAFTQDAKSGTFKNYDDDNLTNGNGNQYHRVYLGTCTERVFTTAPSTEPIITLNGDVKVTSTATQSVKAASVLTVSASNIATSNLSITSDNAAFIVSPTTITVVDKKVGVTPITITYKPTITSDGTETATITVSDGNEASESITVTGRHLPENFVIATKVGATWYALPANMNGATNPEGVVIDVDETNMTAIAPNTTVYTLFPVKTTTGSEDRYAQYGDRVRFSAVNNEYKGLWTSSSESTIRNYAVIDDVKDGSSDDSYEWKITTTIVDGNWQYTLQTDQPNNQKYLRYWTAASGGAKWGTYASGNDKLYFLPVTETKPFDYKVVEWYPTKVLIQTDAAITNPIVKIGGILIDHVTCTNKGGELYEISGLSLAENPTKVLTLSYTADEVTYTNSKVVPIILSRETMTISGEPFASLTKEVYNYADLVVRDGATLTMDGTQEANTLWDVTIYPTSKISVPESKKLTVHSLTFFGGIDEIHNGSTYTLNKYGVPELSLKGSLKKSISTIDYLMRVNLDQMYSLAVPYDVQLADIKYWDGSDIALGTALYVSAYDGEARANQSKKTWIYETDFNPATLKAGVGYTISAELQAGVGSEYSILRMPMNSNIANDATEAAKTVAVTAWGKDANVTDNHKGWNLVGNPYMTTIQGADDADLVLGYLKETGTGPWEWVEKTYRYVTIPSDDGTYYWQPKFTDAVLPPFKNFFVQVGTTGELVFDLGTRQSMPARSTQAAIEKEVEFEILMSNATRQDNTGLLISEEYSPAYEINADLEKMIGSMSVYTIYGGYKLAYNALSPINASEWIPMGYIAPAAGEYTFRLDDIDKIVEQVEHVYLIDYEANNIVDLMDEEYKFTTDKEQNNNRFAINIVLIQDKDNTTTGMDIINGNVAAPIKFIYHDKMYIQSGGVIYDGTGKQVTNINK